MGGVGQRQWLAVLGGGHVVERALPNPGRAAVAAGDASRLDALHGFLSEDVPSSGYQVFVAKNPEHEPFDCYFTYDLIGARFHG